jgi:hypothetical protein
MVEKVTFHGTYHYYQNINGKVKKVEKTFTDRKKYDEFMKKAPMPTLGSLFGQGTAKKALPTKKSCCCSCKTKKPTTKKKK